MPSLEAATADQIDRIAAESHALWGAELTPAAYRGMWDELSASPWGREHTRFLVWVDEDGHLLSSLKTYRPRLLLDGREGTALVVGAIFTPPRHRGRGHARSMLSAVLARAAAEGVAAALLFSDIGERYYGGSGFLPLTADEQWGRLPDPVVGPAVEPVRWRDAGAADRDAIRSAHEDFCRRQPLALLRDGGHWDYLDLRSRSYFERLGRNDLTQHLRVAVSGGRFLGYLLTVEGRGEWSVREVGVPGGRPEPMAALVRLGAIEAVRAGLRRFYAWWPDEICRQLSDWPIRRRRRPRAIPMIRPLDTEARAMDRETLARAYLPFQDQF